MKYVLLATASCQGDITTCCNDYGIALYLRSVQRSLALIHFIVPVILIVMASINLVQLMLGPDDPQKKRWKSLINKFIAAVIVYFVPLLANLFFSFMPDSIDIKGCWKAANETASILDNTEYQSVKTINQKKQSGTIGNNTKTKVSAYKSELVAESDAKSKNSTKKSSGTIKGTKDGKEVVAYAKQFIGNPYVYGGTSLTKGTDCSGFTQSIYKHFGINIQRTAASQATQGKKVASLDDAQAGDLFFYGSGGITHVAMYEGNGKIVHAKGRNYGIVEESASRTPVAIRRYLKN